MDYKNNWRIRVAFRTSIGELKTLSYPWGTIPYLRLGQVYSNGVYDQIKPLSGSAYKITIDRLDQAILVNGFKLPKRLIDFGKNPELGLQKIIQFQSNGITFSIPVIELIRAMFINSRYLSYYLLQPHGLDLLVDKSELQGKTLLFDLSSRVPAKLASENNACHLSWIHTDSAIRSMWDSVHQLMFSQAIKDTPHNPIARMKKGIPLDIDLQQPIGPIEMYIRGVQFRDSVLVKEITGFNGFEHPAEDIEFWHPSKKRRESLSADKQVRLTTRSKNDDYILDENSDNAKEDTNQDVLEVPPTYLKFANIPVVTTRREDVRKTHTGNDVIVTTGRGGKNSGGPEEVSAQDSVVGGDTPPIDFQTIEIIPATEAFGLESFFEMIQIFKQTFPVEVRMSILRVPAGKRFSVCANGARRSCAVVQVTNGNGTRYIIEIARPDDWSISTLILQPVGKFDLKTIETNIKLLLDGLVAKGGHWDQSVLDRSRNMNIEKVKHYLSDTTRDWAYRIANKLI